MTTPMSTFHSLGLNSKIIAAVDDLGFEVPTPIQVQAIPHLLDKDQDILAFAQTGTGKTAAFGLPILQKILFDKTIPQALILCPTRELCLQITRDFESYAKYLPDINIVEV